MRSNDCLYYPSYFYSNIGQRKIIVSVHILGARITSYLLEVPRVVGHAEGERNYHVFYQILEGLKDSIKGLQGQYQLGTDPAIFKYLQPYLPSKTSTSASSMYTDMALHSRRFDRHVVALSLYL